MPYIIVHYPVLFNNQGGYYNSLKLLQAFELAPRASEASCLEQLFWNSVGAEPRSNTLSVQMY